MRLQQQVNLIMYVHSRKHCVADSHGANRIEIRNYCRCRCA